MKTTPTIILSLASLASTTVSAFVVVPQSSASAIGSKTTIVTSTTRTRLFETIVSPFDNQNSAEDESGDEPGVATLDTIDAQTAASKDKGPLDLTWENVDMILDEMRPYLISDGGNVEISEIDGPVVRLELIGACGTCPSSTQTLKMGLERGLRDRIPEIQEVVQYLPSGPPLDEEQIDVVLDGVRPFLQVAGGSINLDRIDGEGGLQPTIWLLMEGSSSSLNSVKLEIAQRLQRHFMMPGLHIEWVGDDDGSF